MLSHWFNKGKDVLTTFARHLENLDFGKYVHYYVHELMGIYFGDGSNDGVEGFEKLGVCVTDVF